MHGKTSAISSRHLFIFIIMLFTAMTMEAQNTPKDSEAKLISAPPFTLSDEAQAAGIDGTLKIGLTVSKDGSVKVAEVLDGFSWPCGESPTKIIADVRREIIQVMMAAKFQAATKNSEPVSQDLLVTLPIGETHRKEMEAGKKQKGPTDATAVPTTISGGVLNGKAKRLPKPAFPPNAYSVKASGAVAVQILVDETGNVVRAGGVSGHPALLDAARDAACSAKFAPTFLKGNLVKVSGVITYNFVP